MGGNGSTLLEAKGRGVVWGVHRGENWNENNI